MRLRKIKAGKAYSNGKRVRIVDFVDNPDCGMVDFHEASDGFNSPILSMELDQFAQWAEFEVKPNWVRA